MTRLRFAPSPTGYLHIGGARTFLFNWIYARQNGGTMILRIDDTDTDRNTIPSLDSIHAGLDWLGLGWDEKYVQSERTALYREAARTLLSKGSAYRDFTQTGEKPVDGTKGWTCNDGMRDLGQVESDRRASSGEPFVLRFRVPRHHGSRVAFNDLVFGHMQKAAEDIEDFALIRSDGSPTYHLASSVDDLDLRISHILRGQEHLNNAFKHLLLFDALSPVAPKMGHFPILLAPDGSKLSKRRHGPAVSVTTYRDAGFLPSGFLNFVALLGWSPKRDQEYLTLDEDLMRLFNLDDVKRSNAIVNFTDELPIDPKALHINSLHIKRSALESIRPYVVRALRAAGIYEANSIANLDQIVAAIRPRFRTLAEFATAGKAYFSNDFELDALSQSCLDSEDANRLLCDLIDLVNSMSSVDATTAEIAIRCYAAETGVSLKRVLSILRASLTGCSVGPSAFELISLVGRRSAVQRMSRYAKQVANQA